MAGRDLAQSDSSCYKLSLIVEDLPSSFLQAKLTIPLASLDQFLLYSLPRLIAGSVVHVVSALTMIFEGKGREVIDLLPLKSSKANSTGTRSNVVPFQS